jgi:hypothetical protein
VIDGLKQISWLLAALVVCSGCRSGSDEKDGENGNERVLDPGDIDLDAECPSRLDPMLPFGREETVGDGTAASCSESALRAALEAIRGAEGGGTITFDCGSEHTIELTESLFVDTALLVDGEGGITLSGGGVTRVFELDHYGELTVQRLTIADGRTEESGAVSI